MTDFLTRGFRAQLTTAMDSVLRKALVDIMAIFESSLHDHQMELVQKGEEIAHLKIKLQTAELKLKQHEGGVDGGVEMNKKEKTTKEAQKESEVVLKPTGQNSDVPEIDFEVPDDWCAPLGCETVTKQDDDVCPSIRLRPLLIPLWRIPVIKQEEASRDIDMHQRGTGLRRSKRGTSLNERHEDIRDKSLPMHNQTTRRKPVRSDIKKLLQDIKEEYSFQTDRIRLRRRVRNLTGQEQKNRVKTRREESEITAVESKPIEQKTEEDNDKKRYSCKFCKKSFDTVFGRDVHIRSHKTCKGCKKEFSFPSVLRCHKSSCEKFKKLLKKRAERTNPPQPASHDELKPTLTNKKQLCDSEEGLPSSDNESSNQNSVPTTRDTCTFCSKRFSSRCRLMDHMRVHTGEKPFPCSMCPKRFRVKQSRKKHIMRMHQKQKDSTEPNGDLAWTEPLEDTEDNREDVISPSNDSGHTIKHNNIKEQCNPGVRLRYRWQTKGVQSSNGFSCLLCQKFVRTKRALREHVRLHTGERPISCEECSAKFRTDQQLYTHKKKMHYPGTQSVKHQKRVKSRLRYNKHVYSRIEDWPNACKVCGKGFVTKGHLNNHMERYHN